MSMTIEERDYRNREWARLYKEGKSTGYIAGMYDMSITAVRHGLKRAGITLDPNYNPMRGSGVGTKKAVQIMALYGEGYNAAAIARSIGCHSSAIYSFFKKQGIYFRKESNETPDTTEHEIRTGALQQA